MNKIFVLGLVGILMRVCSSVSDPEVVLKTEPDQKKPKHGHMPPPEKPVENQETPKNFSPIAPQREVRIPSEK